MRAASDSPGKEFVTLVEVFPPTFSLDPGREPDIGLREKSRDFVERVRRVRHLADAVLVAEVKDAGRVRLSAVHSAALLREEAGVEAVPVITARDSNRAGVRSAVLTAFALGIESLMLAWGDRYTEADGIGNAYDYDGLSEMLAEARLLAERAGVRAELFAPVDLTRLSSKKGVEMTRQRVRSGATRLLAQPPTTDAFATLAQHVRTLSDLDLKSKILLNVFPFRGTSDVDACRTRFGWKLPHQLDELALGGEPPLLKEARRVSEQIREAGLPGVYVSTRGRPELARFILE